MKQFIAALVISVFSMTAFSADYLAQAEFDAAKTTPAQAALRIIKAELAVPGSTLVNAIELELVIEHKMLVTPVLADLVLLDSTTGGANNVNQQYIVPLRVAWKSSTTAAGFLVVRANFTDEGPGVVTVERVIQVPDLGE